MSRRTAPWDVRARAQLELRRRRAAKQEPSLEKRYRDDPVGYITDKLGWSPWKGTPDHPGQVEVIHAYRLAIRQQLERQAYQNGDITEDELRYWTPGSIIKFVIRVEAGHTVGKTKVASGIVNHFFDCYPPSLVYTFAPTSDQINKLLWKEIRSDREGKALPGRVYDGKPEMTRSADHFAVGKATSDSHGRGTERVQGQHGPFLMFVLDEAEGIADYVFDAIESMTSGGVVIVLMLANPRTRISRFHKTKAQPTTRSFRISCLGHPNVVEGREAVPHAVRREWVEMMIDKHCEVASEHNPDEDTFTVPFPVVMKSGVCPPGTVFRPNSAFMFRVLGKAPANFADNTFVPVGRFEAAVARAPTEDRPHIARIGIDVARFGADYGTIFVRWNGRIWRAARLSKRDTNVYARKAKDVALQLKPQGATDVRFRIDGGGGFGGGVVDKLKIDLDLIRAFRVLQVLEVHFNGRPHDRKAYSNLVTEMYAEAAETIRGVSIQDPPEALEADLCERTFDWVNYKGRDVRRLSEKKRFRKDHGRSPDDGDGFALAAAPDFVFERTKARAVASRSYATL